MNLNSENHVEPVRSSADEPTNEPRSQGQSGTLHQEPINPTSFETRIDKCTRIVSKIGKLVIVTAFLICELFGLGKFAIFEVTELIARLSSVVTKPPNAKPGPERSNEPEQTLQTPAERSTNQPANDTLLLTTNVRTPLDSNSSPSPKRSHHPFMARTARSRVSPAPAEAHARPLLPEGIFRIGVPVTLRKENGQWRPHELQSPATVQGAWGNTPAGR